MASLYNELDSAVDISTQTTFWDRVRFWQDQLNSSTFPAVANGFYEQGFEAMEGMFMSYDHLRDVGCHCSRICMDNRVFFEIEFSSPSKGVAHSLGFYSTGKEVFIMDINRGVTSLSCDSFSERFDELVKGPLSYLKASRFDFSHYKIVRYLEGG